MVTLMMLKPLVFIVSLTSVLCAKDEEVQAVIPPTNCEVCKYLAAELRDRLVETGKNKEVIGTGHGLEPRKKKFKYNTSELRLIEALTEPHVCDEMLKYNVHKERKGSLRFAKGRSETFETLQKLVNRGVNVKMDVPYELWNDTSAEVTQMYKRCFHLVEQFEDEIEDWYYSNQDRDIVDFLCRDTVLKGDDQCCLDEVYVPKGESDDDDEEDDDDDDEVEKKNKKKPKSDKAAKKGKKNKKDKPKKKGDSSKKDKKSKHAKKEEL